MNAAQASSARLDARYSQSTPIESLWARTCDELLLISPNNRQKFSIIVVGTGLAGASAAATLAQQGYRVKAFTTLDSPRRAHSISAQGGINAAKNYQNDGDSVFRLFQDTLKGGDFRAREANVYRLAQLSGSLIDLCVAQGVPFARDYAGYLDNRSFGGVQVSRTFYAKGQTGQQLLLGAYGALLCAADRNGLEIVTRREMLDLVVIDGRARGIITRHTLTGEIEAHAADAVLLCTGGYANVFYLSTNALHCNVTAAWSCYKHGAAFANPCFTQIHPTCIPKHGDDQSKLTLMSESLRNDGRIWVPKQPEDRPAHDIPEEARDYYLERLYPSFGNLVPRDIASRAAERVCSDGRGIGPTRHAVYLDFATAIARQGRSRIEDKYGNLFEMYERITADDPYKTPMRIYPAAHYTMGGLWVDYHLMTTVPGLFCLGEANFSDHGANRLGASALMQGLADGYFVAPATVPNYLAGAHLKPVNETHDAFQSAKANLGERLQSLCRGGGQSTPMSLHKALGQIMRDHVGMSRHAQGLKQALHDINGVKTRFESDLLLGGQPDAFNTELEKAIHLADYLELAALMAKDALHRAESCGGHFRTEFQTETGECLRNDKDFAHVAAWYDGQDEPTLEPLTFSLAKPIERHYE
ncbi:MAG: fumarate reductase/succinate dehydrogenase flavoprotein subunit [Proteobacteria bacterium]|nr:fumarate reductase/succinate dehydrogenase flavoprotein subunit [Pseudomonadota bacterium]